MAKWLITNVLGVLVAIFIVYQILMFLIEKIGGFIPKPARKAISKAAGFISEAIAPFVGYGVINNLLTMVIFVAVIVGIGRAITSTNS